MELVHFVLDLVHVLLFVNVVKESMLEQRFWSFYAQHISTCLLLVPKLLGGEATYFDGS
jgi:hypothetical protein